MQATRSSKNMGFTIVELLIVIVVIGILAAISIVSYSGVSKQAVVTTIKSDLDGSRKQIEMFEIEKGVYPETIDCSQPTTEKNTCLPLSGGNVVSYYRAIDDGATKSYYLTITNGANSYNITNSTSIEVGVIKPEAHTTKSCPPNYVMVPGNGALGTPNDFCVMKYEAKHGASDLPVSTPSGLPWTDVSRDTILSSSFDLGAGNRLISEFEWLTIANNIFYVGSNWSGSTVGSGYVFSGHNDYGPNHILEVSNVSNPYDNTDNSSDDSTTKKGMVGNSQRRTLNLSNGEVIWDFSGNVAEFTSGTMSNQPGYASDQFSYKVREWSDSSLIFNGLPLFSLPPSGYGSASGIGMLSSNYGEVVEKSYTRGGTLTSGPSAGIYSLNLKAGTDSSTPSTGFRLTCDPS